MTFHTTRWWKAAVWLAALAGIVTLWVLTAGEDSEWTLWRHYIAGTAAMNIVWSGAIVLLAYVMTSTRSMAGRLARVVAISLAASVTLAALELPAVVWGHDYGLTFGTRDNDTWLQLATGINRYDEELLHVHQPHSQFRGTVGGNLARLGLPYPARHAVDVRYDRNGFRNDVDFTQAEVVAIGDSFVEGAETPNAQTVVGELARRLGLTVVNLGQSNYGPQQELVVLKRYGTPLSPKAVVWFVFGNDLVDVDLYEWRRQHLTEYLAPPPLAWRSFTRNALMAIAHLTTPTRRVPTATARRHEMTFTRADGRREILYLDSPEGPWTAHQWDVLSHTLLDARALSTNAGAEFLVVYIPRKQRVYTGAVDAAPDSFARTWVLNNLPQVMGEFCQEHAIPFLDSTMALRKAVNAGESVYLPDDVHWNPAGHRVVAAAVAERLQHIVGSPVATSGSPR
jgi:hypothetical protein